MKLGSSSFQNFMDNVGNDHVILKLDYQQKQNKTTTLFDPLSRVQLVLDHVRPGIRNYDLWAKFSSFSINSFIRT